MATEIEVRRMKAFVRGAHRAVTTDGAPTAFFRVVGPSLALCEVCGDACSAPQSTQATFDGASVHALCAACVTLVLGAYPNRRELQARVLSWTVYLAVRS
jgi:hypothetical protein